MKNMITTDMMIVERPAGLIDRTHGKNAEFFNNLANTLTVLASTKAVSFHLDELSSKLGKTYKTKIKSAMRARGIPKTNICLQDSTVYVWKKEGK